MGLILETFLVSINLDMGYTTLFTTEVIISKARIAEMPVSGTLHSEMISFTSPG